MWVVFSDCIVVFLSFGEKGHQKLNNNNNLFLWNAFFSVLLGIWRSDGMISKFSCTKCHHGVKLQAESQYDTECTRNYHIILTLNLITNLSYLKVTKIFKQHDFIQQNMSKNAFNCPKWCTNALHMHTRMFRIRYTNLAQPLTQDDTVQGQWLYSLCNYWHGTVLSRVSCAFVVCIKFT